MSKQWTVVIGVVVGIFALCIVGMAGACYRTLFRKAKDLSRIPKQRAHVVRICECFLQKIDFICVIRPFEIFAIKNVR